MESGGARSGSRYDVIVVGSGLGGISAAALLAKAGRKVLVAEQAEGPGGYARSFTRGPYTFDPAVHAMPEVEFVQALLDYLEVSDRVSFVPSDCVYRVIFPGLDVKMPFGMKEYVAKHVEYFPHELEGIQAFIGLRDQMFREASQIPHDLSFRNLDRAAELFPTFFKYRTASVGDVLDGLCRDPKLKALLGCSWPYQGVPPGRLSFLWFVQVLSCMVRGAYYSLGGFQKLVDAFVAALEKDGGTLIVNSPVVRILVENNRVCGIELESGQQFTAPVVISNADARQTFDSLLGEALLPPAYVQRLHRLKPSLSACSVYAATRLDLGALGTAHETFVFRHWDHEETYRDILEGRLGGMWMSIASHVDPSLAPPGEHTVILTTLARYDGEENWKRKRERFQEELLDVVESVYPGFREALTHVEVATPVTLERYSRNFQGAAYGWEPITRQIGTSRLTHQTPIDGLYLSGHWTQQNHGSLRVMVSGDHVARLILARSGETLPVFRPAHLPPLAM